MMKSGGPFKSARGGFRLLSDKNIEKIHKLSCLVLEVIARDGNFLAEEHTAKSVRGACWEPQVFGHTKPSEHAELLCAAREKTDHILRTHDPRPLSEEQEREISRIVKRAEKAKGVV